MFRAFRGIGFQPVIHIPFSACGIAFKSRRGSRQDFRRPSSSSTWDRLAACRQRADPAETLDGLLIYSIFEN
ncbi:hypothetical protein RMSM_02932 [Rhodopirellula maiorica SM1]|uniref:Uncharacterized protein n=1 Tax=Rhodopirellula maiorica SM1 TaxID=1265738 RepID=M5S1U0_9BACT|nr:hypothetical protein RMSM_02932 [Rhodopirellula maiorica SM1]